MRVEAEDAKLGAEHSSARIRVVLADDALLLRQALAEGLKAAGFDVVGQAGDVAGLLSLVETQAPDVAVVDVRMPPTHTTEGLEAAREIRRQHPGSAILVLSQYVETRYAIDLIRDGPSGAWRHITEPRLNSRTHEWLRAAPPPRPAFGPDVPRRQTDPDGSFWRSEKFDARTGAPPMPSSQMRLHNARHAVIGPTALSAMTLAVVLATLLPSTVGEQVDAAYAIGSKVVLSAFAIAVLTYLGWWGRTGFRQLPGRRDAVWLAPPALLVGAMLAVVVAAGPVPMETGDAIAFAAVAFGTGFSEEALFRGALLEQMRPWGVRQALIGSAVAFALIHFVGVLGGADWGATAAQVFLYALPWGVAFAGLRLTGRSIWPLVAIHAANNFGGYLTTGAWVNQPADVERFAAAGLLQAALLLTLAAYGAWFIWHPPTGVPGGRQRIGR